MRARACAKGQGWVDYSCETFSRELGLNPQIAAAVDRMGIEAGDLILEIGYDAADCDAELRSALASKSGNELLDSNSQEVVDAVILWWREDDGDLVDELVDALTFLIEDGDIWVLNPKVGSAGHIEPSEIQDAAPTAGLTQTISFVAAPQWTATRLVPRKSKK
jgi:hypothetical protein